MEYRNLVRSLSFVFLLPAATGCELFEPPNPGSLVDLELTQENGDCVTITFTPSLPEETETVEFDFGDGTTFEGANPPPHTYCHRGAYSMSMVASGENWSATYPELITVTDTKLPPVDALLGMGSVGTELHAVNLVRVSIQRRYQSLGRAFAITHDAEGVRKRFEGDLAIEITPPSGGSNGADPAPALQVLVADPDLIYSINLANYVHVAFPPWFVDDTLVATLPSVFPTANRGEYEIDLPLRVEAVPALNAPFVLRLFRGLTGGADSVRYVLRRNDQVWAFDAPVGETTVTVSSEQMAEIGPGILEVWAVTSLHSTAADDDDVVFVASFTEAKSIVLTEGAIDGSDGGVSDAGISNDAGSAGDAGSANDAGAVDAGGSGDAGPPLVDGGTEASDAGADDAGPGVDAGTVEDAGAVNDAGPPGNDAG